MKEDHEVEERLLRNLLGGKGWYLDLASGIRE